MAANDISSLATTLQAQAKNVRQFVRDVAKDAAKIAREEHRTAAAAGTGGDRRFSNFKGPALDVKAKYEPGGVQIVPRGPWKIVEEGAAPHGNHPGTRATQGRKLWTRAEEATVDRLDRVIPDGVDAAMEAGFRAG